MPRRNGRSGCRFMEDEAQKARIASLQSEVARLEREKALEIQRTKLNIQRMKELSEAQDGSSGAAKHLFSKPEDLNLDELTELFHGLSHLKERVAQQLSKESVGPSAPPLPRSLSSVQAPPKEEKP